MAGGYNWAADGLGSSVADAFGGIAAELDAKRRAALVAKAVENFKELEMDNAANLAEKHALRKALERIDPNHPLLANTILREKIQAAGCRALVIANDWAAVRNAGESFKY